MRLGVLPLALVACSRTGLGPPDDIGQGGAGAGSSSASVTSSVTSASTGPAPAGAGGCGQLAETCPGEQPCESPSVSAVPILHYPFDGTTDNIGTVAGFTGVATRAAFVPGKIGGAVKFSGGVSEVLLPGTRTLLGTLSVATLGLWFREDTYVTEDFPHLLQCRSFSNGFETYHGLTLECSLTTCWGYGSPDYGPGGCNSFQYAVGPWHHVALVYGAAMDAEIGFYLDARGVTATSNGGDWPIFDPAMEDLRVGTGSELYVDDLRVYDRSFDARELCLEVIGGQWCSDCCVLP